MVAPVGRTSAALRPQVPSKGLLPPGTDNWHCSILVSRKGVFRDSQHTVTPISTILPWTQVRSSHLWCGHWDSGRCQLSGLSGLSHQYRGSIPQGHAPWCWSPECLPHPTWSMIQALVLIIKTRHHETHQGEEQCSLPVQASSFSLDEVVTGVDIVPSQDDYRAHQEFLKRVAQNLGILVEEIRESSHAQVDIVVAMGPSRVALPLNDVIMDAIKALWQTHRLKACWAKKMEKKYFVPAKGYEFLYMHPPLGSSVNEREREGQQGPTPKARMPKY